MKKNLFLLGVLFSISATSQIVQAKTDIDFILDISGSMKQVSGGESQIDSARKAIANVVKDVPSGTYVALRLYGHRVEQTKKDESCKDTELAVPFGDISTNGATINTKMSGLIPKGYTPIAYSLEQSRSDFDTTREADKTIILMTDGEETCGGDAVAVLKKMQEDGFKVVVHTVGFNVDANTRKQLEDIAATGGGQYFDAKGGAGLNDALKKATQASLVVDKKVTTYGSEIRGGDSYETAVPMDFDKEYKLDHHQKTKQYDYFLLNLEQGQEVTVQINTLEKGIHINDQGVASDAGDVRPYAGIQLHDSNRARLNGVEIIGTPHTLQKFTQNIPAAGKYFILVGSEYDDINKDHTTFKVTSVSHGDAGTGKDAGQEMASAMPIEAKKYEQNYLGGGDAKDLYSFNAKAGDSYFIGFVPGGTGTPMINLIVHDSYKQNLFSKMSSPGQGMKSDVFKITDEGTYYISIENVGSYQDLYPYVLELKKMEAPVAAAPTEAAPVTTTPPAGN